ncbi:tRNA pseudouridine32 synthase/23S rRNA pseudouridine746 synthase [Sphingobium subterraneum]|uniref:tRNA pseudouridine32 synthase/23S rRNA pseudouridine746 synthase n=1 Tax=Sphingobium subterraneum TaxID=627688 RepID=A0A841J0A8_9SPHN|nr:tRNA pseudouridine32 synthase/23S rRNA pseudouridine746 synthase [Sphingobium subterraneum]
MADRILFMDGEAIVIDKPAGLPVDPPRDGSLSLENHLASLTFGFHRWPLAVHRLDRDTSGCLLLARNPKAHKRFTQTFESQKIGKTYVAVLDGIVEAESGTIELPLRKVSSAEEGWRIVGDLGAKRPGTKHATTEWNVVTRKDGRTLVAFHPATGRTHQIRVHALEGLGLPIVGDPVYGTASPGHMPMLLHALRLEVPRANGKAPIIATAPLPDRFITAGFAAELMEERTAAPSPAPHDVAL